jgi:hypothetical protein
LTKRDVRLAAEVLVVDVVVWSESIKECLPSERELECMSASSLVTDAAETEYLEVAREDEDDKLEEDRVLRP